MTTPNNGFRQSADRDELQPADSNSDNSPPQETEQHTATSTAAPANLQPHLRQDQPRNPHTNPNRDANLTNTTTSNNRHHNGGTVRVRVVVSTVSPQSVSPALRTLHTHYPRDFENFTEDEVVNSLTNYEYRHIQSFRAQKAESIPHPADVKSTFYSVSEPDIPLMEYVQRLVRYSKVARIHFLMMVIYVDHIADTDIALVPSERNVHRLLAGGLALAAQQHNVLDKAHARRVAGLSTEAELTKIMDTFLQLTSNQTEITQEELTTTFNHLSAMRHTTDRPTEENMSTVTAATRNEGTQNDNENGAVSAPAAGIDETEQ